VEPEAELLGDRPVRLPRARREPEAVRLDVEPGPHRYLPLLLLLLVVAVVVAGVAATAWHADQQARAHESAALATCHQKLRSAAVSADLLLGAVAHNLRPQLAAARGQRRDVVARIMANPARQLLPDVATAVHACRAISVLPWHRALVGRRDAAVDYSSALAAKVQRIAADGREFYRDEPSLRRLRRAADIGVLGGRY
jgi:hypothetical protein